MNSVPAVRCNAGSGEPKPPAGGELRLSIVMFVFLLQVTDSDTFMNVYKPCPTESPGPLVCPDWTGGDTRPKKVQMRLKNVSEAGSSWKGVLAWRQAEKFIHHSWNVPHATTPEGHSKRRPVLHSGSSNNQPQDVIEIRLRVRSQEFWGCR